MDRRAFFTKSVGKVARTVSDHAAEKAAANASRWIRPPFAIEELDFLLACSRCGDCIEACPHDVIFPLASRLGAKVFSTPAMDLANQGCHLCVDWPCVSVCEPKALLLPTAVNKTKEDNAADLEVSTEQLEVSEDKNSHGLDYDEKILPKIANVYINESTCLPYSGPECGACNVCPVEGAMIWVMEKPEINQTLCTGCALCREACIVEPKAVIVQSKYKPLN